MSLISKYIAVFSVLITVFFSAEAQDEKENSTTNDTLSTESVIVIKTFNPTINDAFKLKTTPHFDAKQTEVKPNLDYQINSVPVASTFVPEKTKAVEVKKEKPVSQFSNYALLAVGNFINVNAEFFSTVKIDRDSQFSVLLEHLSSQGGIDDVELDDHYYDTGLQLTYNKQSKKLDWSADIELQHQLYNWYGIAPDLGLTQAEIVSIDPAHNFIDANVGSQLYFDNAIFKSAKIRFRHFRDDFDSSENNFIIQPEFNVSLDNIDIKIPVTLDFLSGSFEESPFLPQNKYSILNAGISPSMALQLQGISLQVGVTGFLSNDSENDKLRLFAYPNITANYEIPQYNLTAFGGITGGLQQNTYHNAAAENVYTAPLLEITPTSQVFNVYAGVKGSFDGNFGYEAKASFALENDKPLWTKSVDLISVNDDLIPFGQSNSFVYVYDDVTIGELDAKLSYEVENNYGISLSGIFTTYGLNDEDEAWNLPTIRGNLQANYFFTPKIKASTGLFFMGSRKDINQITGATVDVDGYFDANLRIDYKINEQWQAFIMGNNLTGQNYEYWQDYQVQSIQFLLGAKYQF